MNGCIGWWKLGVGLLACCLVPEVRAQTNDLRPGSVAPQTLPAEAVNGANPIRRSAEASDIKPAAHAASSASASAAARANATSREAQLLLNEAFTLSKSPRTAGSVEDLTKIIELCKEASLKRITAEELSYANSLMAWAYNKRGEAYAAEAVEFTAAGSEQDAAKLDRLALRDFSAAIRLNPEQWRALHNRGVSYGILGLHDDALADFTAVVKLKPEHTDAWFNRAEVSYESGRYAQAASDYAKVIELKPDDGVAYRGRGRALLALRKDRDALADLNRAVELQSGDAVSWAARGEACARLGEWENAAEDFRSAISLDPDCAEAYRGAAWVMASCPQVKYRNAKMAIQAAEQALELAEAQGTRSYQHYDALAAAYANAGRFAEAQHEVRKGLSAAPAAAATGLKERLALYAAQRPFREGTPAVAATPASAKVPRR
jgi:tetratricopeptide (TPR) repeat protein